MSSTKNVKILLSPLSYPLIQYPICFIDYLWVISVYITSCFSLAVFIDGYLLPPFDLEQESKESSLFIAVKVLLQLAFQGFIAIFLCAVLQKIPSPVNNICGYDSQTTLGVLIRNPAIISAILLLLSQSLRNRALHLFSRIQKAFVNTAPKLNGGHKAL